MDLFLMLALRNPDCVDKLCDQGRAGLLGLKPVRIREENRGMPTPGSGQNYPGAIFV